MNASRAKPIIRLGLLYSTVQSSPAQGVEPDRARGAYSASLETWPSPASGLFSRLYNSAALPKSPESDFRTQARTRLGR